MAAGGSTPQRVWWLMPKGLWWFLVTSVLVTSAGDLVPEPAWSCSARGARVGCGRSGGVRASTVDDTGHFKWISIFGVPGWLALF